MLTDAPQIEFRCPGCGKRFRVPASYAGRNARCKGCNAVVVVPEAAAAPNVVRPAPGDVIASASPAMRAPAPPAAPRQPAPPPPAPRVPMRLRRLRADAIAMREAFGKPGAIRLRETIGDPADTYRLEFHVTGLVREGDDDPVPKPTHLVQIQLTSDYPRICPKCTMLTPIFHPNIANGAICVGDHWTAGERLPDLATRIAEMIAYQAYNIKSPLDAEAAMWADLNQDRLPIDSRSLTLAPEK